MSANHDGPDARDEDEKVGPFEQVLSALGLQRKPRHEAESDAERAGNDLVDQAEAFQQVNVGDIMIPRADIVALEIGAPLSAVAAQFIDSEHSRLPVYRESLDDPVGFVHIK